MDDIEKLSCKEELDISDIEHSATDEHKDVEEKPKKKKRRRREIDMIKLSEDEDTEDEGSGKRLRPSPGPNSPAAHREPRTCVLKASQKRRPLSRLLEQLLRNLEKRDPHQFFAWPVNDTFAPNYSNVIRRPMDFSTIKQKIDDNEYRSLNCFISDFKLMCNNAMKYNKPGTVYHKAAKRLMHAGLRQLAPAKLRPLAEILTYMYEIPIRELGFDIGKMDVHKVLRRAVGGGAGGEAGDAAGSEGDGEGGGRGGGERDGDSGPRGGGGADGRKLAMAARRELLRKRLAKQAFPRMDASGRTTLCVVPAPADGSAPTVGQLLGKLTHGTGTLHTAREDRRNVAKPVKPLHYGPFASFAPSYDSTFATLTAHETHLLLHTLPYETGCGSQQSLRFAPDSPWRLLFDMDGMFPAKPGAAAAAAQPNPQEEDLSKVKIDVEQLKSLSSLGIDMEFLSEIEDEVRGSQRDLGLSAALAHTADLLARLETEQTHRLSLPPPWHLSLCPGPGGGERELARRAAAGLRAMAARLRPRDLAPPRALRPALGVTLAHLDTPLAVDELDEGELSGRDGSDADSRDSRDK